MNSKLKSSNSFNHSETPQQSKRVGTYHLRPLRTWWLAIVPAVVLAVQSRHSQAAEFLLPPNSGAINVKTELVSLGIHTSNAIGNGSTDDRAAIQAAINWALDRSGNTRYSAPNMLYFPNGTYLIEDTIQSRVSTSGFSSGWRSGMILIGQSRDGTIIKLKNNAAGFTDALARKSMIITGSENPNNTSEATDGSGNEAFRHQIRNLTVDTGSGNVGAVAIDFNASNRGTVKDVLIKTSDTSKRGIIGLELRKNGDGVGPLLIKNVTIDGFDTGIQGSNSTFSSTFENITLTNQKVVGVQPGGSMFTFRNLISQNTVSVIKADSNIAHVSVIGGNFSGGAAGNSAVINGGKLLLRDIQSAGYGIVVDNNSGGSPNVPGGAGTSTLNEFTSHPVETLFAGSSRATLRLPIEETPTYTNNTFSEWANVETFGATKNNSADDDRAAIQAAIDSGAKVVYFPNGSYSVGGQIVIRNSVRRLIGFESSIKQITGFPDAQLIRFDSTNVVVVENLNIKGNVTHNSSGSLAFAHCDISGETYSNSAAGTGKTFIEDCIAPVFRLIGPSHRFWARQLNTEHNVTEFRNDGATVWMLGWKTEHQYNKLEALNGSSTEIFGGHHFANNDAA
ncbi:MAG: glycoside hydrolase family 55 protein, partial [Gloeobacteraceae cyanobacterium ES-bin-144]|nr:glycoside hydrolase family 55 protein [Verrucomicrobiales bacterium]